MQQKQIVLDLLDRAEAQGVAHDRQALMLGGMGGAGKSAALESDAVTALGIDKGRFLTVNPDEIMASRGMIPEYDGLTPMEASTFVHEESSDISLMLAREAVARDMNIAWDMTMHSAWNHRRGMGEVARTVMEGQCLTAGERELLRWRVG